MQKLTRSRPRARLKMEFLEDRTTPSAIVQDLRDYVPNRVLVTYGDMNHAAPAAPFVTSVRSLGLGAFAVTIQPAVSVTDAQSYFATQPDVIAAGPDYIVTADRTPNDPSFGTLWAMNNTGQSGGVNNADINAPEAWNVQTGTKNTIVAVIDTGVDYNHPDLAANMWTNTGEIPGDGIDNDHNGFVDDVHGYDFANNDGDPMDDNGHGTHVSGTIGAVGNNGIGVTGVNWNTRIMALKFLDSTGSGSTSNAVAALNYAITMGANISNNSWGGTGPDSTLAAAINRGRSFNHIFVAAAGNSGTNNNTAAFYPANYTLSYDNVVSVAATDRTDSLASFSNYGSTTVTLAAPGVSILSTTPNNTYSTYSGTSMATPHVTGALALLRDQNPTWTYQQLIAKLKSSVDLLPTLTGKVITGGRLDVAKMLDVGSTVPPPPPPPPPPPAGDVTGANITTSVFSGTAATNFNNVRVTFNEAIQAATFTKDDVVLKGPSGAVIAVSGVTVVAGTNNTQFNITFASQTTAGTYTVVIGPQIKDIAGNLMNQNGNTLNGETPGDQFTGSATIGSRKTYTTGTISTTIPDLNTVRIPIVITDNLKITDLDVKFAINHTYDSDLVITLQAPNGSTRTLVNRRGGAGDNFLTTTLDDAATTAITSAAAPFNGTYRPEQALSGFNGLSTLGTWTLIVSDVAQFDSGKVTSFSLSILGTSIQSLSLGFADGTDATESSTPSDREAKIPATSVPLAVWIGPDRSAEPIHSAAIHRGEVLRSLNTTIANSDTTIRTATTEPGRAISTPVNTHVTPMIEFDNADLRMI